MKIAIATEAEPNLPTHYSALAKALDAGGTLAAFGLKGSRPQVYRFANRYKVARAFRTVSLSGYAAPTERAYGALFRILVTWSAAEQYMKIAGLTLERLEGVLSASEHRRCIGAVRAADKEDRFFDAVCSRTHDARLAAEVRDCLSGRRNSVVPLVRAVRHAFAHGDLAPGANSARPGVAQKLAGAACPAILDGLDADFSKRVRAGLTAA